MYLVICLLVKYGIITIAKSKQQVKDVKIRLETNCSPDVEYAQKRVVPQHFKGPNPPLSSQTPGTRHLQSGRKYKTQTCTFPTPVANLNAFPNESAPRSEDGYIWRQRKPKCTSRGATMRYSDEPRLSQLQELQRLCLNWQLWTEPLVFCRALKSKWNP